MDWTHTLKQTSTYSLSLSRSSSHVMWNWEIFIEKWYLFAVFIFYEYVYLINFAGMYGGFPTNLLILDLSSRLKMGNCLWKFLFYRLNGKYISPCNILHIALSNPTVIFFRPPSHLTKTSPILPRRLIIFSTSHMDLLNVLTCYNSDR